MRSNLKRNMRTKVIENVANCVFNDERKAGRETQTQK